MMSTLYNVYQQIHCKPYKKFQLDFLAGVEKIIIKFTQTTKESK